MTPYNSQRAPYKTNDKRRDSMGYHYPQDAIYTNPFMRNHYSRLPIKPTISIKLEGLISQVTKRIIVT